MLIVDPILDSASYMARAHGIDRRRHTRVKLPPVTTPFFPYLSYNRIPLPIVDLSIGGACISDAKEHLTGEVGHVLRLDLCWPVDTESLDVRVVAASRHFNRHLNFQNLSPGSLARLSLLVRCGSAGQRMHLAPSFNTGAVKLQASELWVGVTGDSLAIFDGGSTTALLSSCATTIAFYANALPRVLLNQEGDKSRPALPVEMADALVCLVNIGVPSPRLQRLIDSLVGYIEQRAKAGGGP